MDPRVTMDRHGPFHLGEGQAVALIGDDLGGVRWRTSAKLGAFDELKREMFAANARLNLKKLSLPWLALQNRTTCTARSASSIE